MEEFTLPDLPDKITPIASANVTPPTPQPAPVATPTATVSAEPRVEPKREQPAEPKAEQRAEPTATNTAPNGTQTPPSTASHTTVSGPSIADLMRGVATASQSEEGEEQSTSNEQVVIDARSEAKVNAVKERVIKDILQERPRFVVAFENMQVEGHRIKVEVPTTQLYEEIMRSKTEILMQIAQTAGVTGMLELVIKINEQIRASRPIKLEDRIKFMTERNENILELKRLLDMDYE